MMSWSQSTYTGTGGTGSSSASGGEWVGYDESSSKWAEYGDQYGSDAGSLSSSVADAGSFLPSYNDTDRGTVQNKRQRK